MDCTLCHHEIKDGFCSEFCAETTPQERAAYLTLKPSDFGVYPCARCGATVQDELPPGVAVCAGCGPYRHFKKLLDELGPHLPPDLQVKVAEFVKTHRCR